MRNAPLEKENTHTILNENSPLSCWRLCVCDSESVRHGRKSIQALKILGEHEKHKENGPFEKHDAAR